MKITRSNYIFIEAEDSEELKSIKILLETFCKKVNPKFLKQQKVKFYNREPRFITTYQKESKNIFKIHKANYEVYLRLYQLGFPITEIDKRISNKIEINSYVEPRDEEQKKAIDTILNNKFNYGTLEATPSSGKTYMSIKIASIIKEKTLIIVDMSLLIEQFIESILKFTDVKEDEIGIIRGSNTIIDDKYKIIIATAQTLTKRKDIMEELSEKIGYLIIDEVHVASCNTFQNILPYFKPKYQLGLSGTPHRDDEMEFLIMETVGPIVYIADKQKMIESGSLLVPLLRPIFLKDDENFKKYNLEQEIEFRDVVEQYYLNKKAIDKISKLVKFHYDKNDYQLLICKEVNVINAYYKSLLKIICGNDIDFLAEKERNETLNDLEEQLRLASRQLDIKRDATKRELKMVENNTLDLEVLREKLKKKRKESISKIKKEIENIKTKDWTEFNVVKIHPKFSEIKIITGDDDKKTRDFIIEETNKGNIKILITSVIFDKAISVNRLNIEYLLFSTREIANTIQRIGRIARTFKDKKEAIVYDVIYDHYMSFAQFLSKDKCRMKAHKEATKYHKESLDLFIEYLKARFRKTPIDNNIKQVFEEKYYKKYIIDL